ncbi:MAG: ABC transporter permease [Rhodocyclaceae bacterium]|jgi:phospholipid/cholesterol/gamma-HCH transport system permease protein|nr:MAG: ABC transporter permease [Rhodocyclaceae bacterium]
MPQPAISRSTDGSSTRIVVSGTWTLSGIGDDIHPLEVEMRSLGVTDGVTWDLTGVDRLDSVGAAVLLRGWHGEYPVALLCPDAKRAIIDRLRAVRTRAPERQRRDWLAWVLALGAGAQRFRDHAIEIVALLGRLVLDCAHILRHPADMPWKEVSANLYKAGARALPVTSLVGFLIGVVLSYLSALQLNRFGADVYIVNLLGIGIIRELGPVLVAVLVAGRSGSAMTAQLGVMRVTEEIDALSIMGVSRTLRLVLPKVLALSIAMPLITAWTSGVALIGGMVAAQIQLGLSYGFFIETLPKAVPVANVWIGLAKGLSFGFLIALLACHFGLRVKPNTESLASNTTRSVVTAITMVILADAVFAIATRRIGITG